MRLRSSLLGSVFGFVAILLSAAYCAAVEFTTIPSLSGYTKPLPGLLDLLNLQDPKARVVFEPSSLADLYVCEGAHVSAPTALEVLLAYLDRYSMCLTVQEGPEAIYMIRPVRSAEMQQRSDGNWYCKCIP